MKRVLKSICATAVSVVIGFTAVAPTMAAPISPGKVITDTAIQQVRDDRRGNHNNRPNANRPGNRPNHNTNRPGHRPNNNNWNRPGHRPNNNNWNRPGHRPNSWNQPSRPGHWNGHNGRRYSHPGYRRHNDGWWYPLAAFAAGAAIMGTINQPSQQPVQRAQTMNQNHINWCANRYRSYRASDNSFQPYNGPRAQCFSPY